MPPDVLQARSPAGRRIGRDYAGQDLMLLSVQRRRLFLSDLMRGVTVPHSIDFMATSSFGDAFKSSGVVRIFKGLDASIQGLNMLIVEDIIDTVTLDYLVRILRHASPPAGDLHAAEVAGRGEKPVPVKYIGFDIPDRCVLGYRLDFRRSIAACHTCRPVAGAFSSLGLPLITVKELSFRRRDCLLCSDTSQARVQIPSVSAEIDACSSGIWDGGARHLRRPSCLPRPSLPTGWSWTASRRRCRPQLDAAVISPLPARSGDGSAGAAPAVTSSETYTIQPVTRWRPSPAGSTWAPARWPRSTASPTPTGSSPADVEGRAAPARRRRCPVTARWRACSSGLAARPGQTLAVWLEAREPMTLTVALDGRGIRWSPAAAAAGR